MNYNIVTPLTDLPLKKDCKEGKSGMEGKIDK